MTKSAKPLVVTAGEPAGIGPDLCIALAGTEWSQHIVVVADPGHLRSRAGILGKEIRLAHYDANDSQAPQKGVLRVVPINLAGPATAGQPDAANAQVLLDGLSNAVEGCRSGDFSGLVTGPLQKSIINDAGISFSGHTEFLANATGASTPVMLLVAGNLRVALASTHLPLRDVPDYLTADRLRAVIEVLHADLRRQFAIDEPEIIVCGLNPHAGEGGHLGTEERDIIAPLLQEFRANGKNIRGPLPADTAFTANAGTADAVLAMYHDQGLPVLKYAGFGTAVNVTLGLPIVRTSVDHGTALDIAGTGGAESGSMLAALSLAAELAGT
jgi:4-hydroxythreonine-4-phosphate dehydrogenase